MAVKRQLPGYTLIEMLITVAIFSGLLIIVLGSFATSSSSTAKVGALREKSQAARSLVDQISTDFRFLEFSKKFKLEGFGPPDGDNCQGGPTGNCYILGFHIRGESSLALLVRYPGDPIEGGLTIKRYTIGSRPTGSNHLTLYLEEGRGCTIRSGGGVDNVILNSQCSSSTGGQQDLLSPDFVLHNDTVFPSKFTGLPGSKATTGAPQVASYLTVQLSVKPVDYANGDCNVAGRCYKLETTLNAGIPDEIL